MVGHLQRRGHVAVRVAAEGGYVARGVKVRGVSEGERGAAQGRISTRPRAEARSPLRPVSHVRAEDGRVLGLEVVGYQPRCGDAAGEPPAATHKGRRRARLQRTQERFQADHRLASESPRSPQDPSQAPGRGEGLRATDYEDSRLVFATRKGTPLDAQNIVNRHFKPLLEHAGLPPIRWHDLRHTCATLLLGRGVHPKLVQHLLGHASITMTLDRYSHWLPSMGRHAAEGMDEALG
jgi:hypothetical protein